MKDFDDNYSFVNRFVESFVRTSEDTASWAECGDADNKKINANFKKGGSVGNQTFVHLMNSCASPNICASYSPFFKTSLIPDALYAIATVDLYFDINYEINI